MAEIIQKDGTWTFDGDTLRLTPGRDKSVGLLRRTLGELLVLLRALAGISFEQGKKAGRLRLPHPSAPAAGAAPAGSAHPEEPTAPQRLAPAAEDDHDALLRRLREPGELHHTGVLTDEEFALAKQAVLKRMQGKRR